MSDSNIWTPPTTNKIITPEYTKHILIPKNEFHDVVKWGCDFSLKKYHTPHPEYFGADGLMLPELTPYEVIDGEGNLLMNAGITVMWTALIGGVPTYFSNATSHIGAGDSSTAAAASQTDLQASTNKVRKAMDATYPSISAQSLLLKSTFTTSDGNWAWQEWGVFNASSAGTMLNRRVVSLGTKTSSATWVFTVTLTLA